MTQPWFDENTFGALWGTIAGGGGGTLGGLWGALVGTLAPRGKGRDVLIPIGWAFIVLGVLSLALGLYALIDGQPWGIWYGPVLTGGLFVTLFSLLLPVVYRRYAEAEARRVQAEEFRAQ